MTNNKYKKNEVDREEYGYGFDISAADLGIIGQNRQAKKQNDHENKEKPHNQNNPSTLNQ